MSTFKERLDDQVNEIKKTTPQLGKINSIDYLTEFLLKKQTCLLYDIRAYLQASAEGSPGIKIVQKKPEVPKIPELHPDEEEDTDREW
jgi:hypothetical protein